MPEAQEIHPQDPLREGARATPVETPEWDPEPRELARHIRAIPEINELLERRTDERFAAYASVHPEIASAVELWKKTEGEGVRARTSLKDGSQRIEFRDGEKLEIPRDLARVLERVEELRQQIKMNTVVPEVTAELNTLPFITADTSTGYYRCESCGEKEFAGSRIVYRNLRGSRLDSGERFRFDHQESDYLYLVKSSDLFDRHGWDPTNEKRIIELADLHRLERHADQVPELIREWREFLNPDIREFERYALKRRLREKIVDAIVSRLRQAPENYFAECFDEEELAQNIDALLAGKPARRAGPPGVDLLEAEEAAEKIVAGHLGKP